MRKHVAQLPRVRVRHARTLLIPSTGQIYIIFHGPRRVYHRLDELFENPVIKQHRHRHLSGEIMKNLASRIVYASTIKGVRISFQGLDAEKLTNILDNAIRSSPAPNKRGGGWGSSSWAEPGAEWGSGGWNESRGHIKDDSQ